MTAKIGIDFHGVISAEPQKFATFCQAIRKLGIKVYIISGGPKEDILNYLNQNHIEYDEIWAILDYYQELNIAKCYDDGSFQVPTDLWDKAKARYCTENNIAFHIDDSPVYGAYFTTPYCKYDIKKGCCCLDGGSPINLNRPLEAAQNIASLILNSNDSHHEIEQ